MQFKKLILCTVLLLGIGLTGLQAQTMYVLETSGNQTPYPLNNIKKFTFSSGNITVSKIAGMPDTYSLSGIRYINFADLITNIAMLDKQAEEMTLYPNPVADFLNINLAQLVSQSCVIQILSIDGREVYKETINVQNKVYQINVSLLPQGLYLCVINSGTTSETTKFIKQ